MMAAVLLFDALSRRRAGNKKSRKPGLLHRAYILFNRLYASLIRLDARLTPQSLAACLLINSQKPNAKPKA
jgi:hypothetical protein